MGVVHNHDCEKCFWCEKIQQRLIVVVFFFAFGFVESWLGTLSSYVPGQGRTIGMARASCKRQIGTPDTHVGKGTCRRSIPQRLVAVVNGCTIVLLGIAVVFVWFCACVYVSVHVCEGELVFTMVQSVQCMYIINMLHQCLLVQHPHPHQCCN